jgi:ribosomal protein L37AE/L43A
MKIELTKFKKPTCFNCSNKDSKRFYDVFLFERNRLVRGIILCEKCKNHYKRDKEFRNEMKCRLTEKIEIQNTKLKLK